MRGVVALAGLLMLASCGGSAVGPSDVDLSEFHIETEGTVWEAGSASVTVRNEGGFGHTLVVTREDGTVVAATDLLEPGESSDLEMDLAPGAYLLTCRIVVETPDGRLVDHYQEGMRARVEVRLGSTAAPRRP